MTDHAPRLFWFRRDLRLSDHEGLTAAAAGGPVIPVFILDPETEALGAAAKWRLGLGVAALRARLRARGGDLVLRRGPALDTLRALVAETGAVAAHWSRLYAPDWVARDRGVKAGLRADGTGAQSHPGHLLWEPWEVSPRAGGCFKVYTPFWNTVGPRDVPEALPEPTLTWPAAFPTSERLEDWRLGAAMERGAAVVERFVSVGEAAARVRLDALLERAGGYVRDRDRPDRAATSGLSENLSYGEISPRLIWHAARRTGAPEKFLKELVWRVFAWHLTWHTPRIVADNWRRDWDAFPWRGDNPDAERWRRALTGEPMVDAGMRELFVTGTMHNRVRMLTASYLTKHLLTHWKVGLDWFADCLIDWDPASNALGWQWVAGSGPDAAPYFRVFNPALQAEKFDPDAAYRRRFLLGFDGSRHPDAAAWFDAVPRSWNVAPDDAPPTPLIALAEGRRRALAAYGGALRVD